MKEVDAILRPEETGISDPNSDRRDYITTGSSPLVALLENPWYPPYLPDTSHVHNCMEIGICLTGTGIIRIEGSEYPFKEGDICVAAADVQHSQQNTGDTVTRWRYIIVDERHLSDPVSYRNVEYIQKKIAQLQGKGFFLTLSEETDLLRSTIESMYRVYGRTASCADTRLELMLISLILGLADAYELQQQNGIMINQYTTLNPIRPALSMVSDRYFDKLTIGDMAVSCAMSESYFRKTFEHLMGVRPLEYINRYRINRSMSLLRLTDATVLTISGQVGFPSIATFNRNFLRYTGMSPAEWRQHEKNS